MTALFTALRSRSIHACTSGRVTLEQLGSVLGVCRSSLKLRAEANAMRDEASRLLVECAQLAQAAATGRTERTESTESTDTSRYEGG